MEYDVAVNILCRYNLFYFVFNYISVENITIMCVSAVKGSLYNSNLQEREVPSYILRK